MVLPTKGELGKKTTAFGLFGELASDTTSGMVETRAASKSTLGESTSPLTLGRDGEEFKEEGKERKAYGHQVGSQR